MSGTIRLSQGGNSINLSREIDGVKLGGGTGGGVSTPLNYVNGLTYNGIDTVKWGGALSENTTLNASTNSLLFNFFSSDASIQAIWQWDKTLSTLYRTVYNAQNSKYLAQELLTDRLFWQYARNDSGTSFKGAEFSLDARTSTPIFEIKVINASGNTRGLDAGSGAGSYLRIIDNIDNTGLTYGGNYATNGLLVLNDRWIPDYAAVKSLVNNLIQTGTLNSSTSISVDCSSKQQCMFCLDTSLSSLTLIMTNAVANSIIDYTIKKDVSTDLIITLNSTTMSFVNYDSKSNPISPLSITLSNSSTNMFFTISCKVTGFTDGSSNKITMVQAK